MQQQTPLIVESIKDLFNASGYPYARILSIIPDEANAVWRAKVDVGIVTPDIKDVIVDDRTGQVKEYH